MSASLRTTALALLLVAPACAGDPLYRFPDRLPCRLADDERPIAEPPARPDLEYAPVVDDTVFLLPERLLALPRHREASDVNALDEVPDSSWFKDRIGRRIGQRLASAPPPTEEVAAGPEQGPPPAPPFTVLAPKPGGATPGFLVRDALGRRYLVKLDPASGPGLGSTAEIVGSHLLWACGYNVPDERLLLLSDHALRLSPEARRKGLDEARLAAILGQGARLPDGRLRAIASRILAGAPLGPFSFHGTDAHDPNDRIPHEDRRELRGLAVFFSWIDQVDDKAGNTLDTFVAVPGAAPRGFVRHNLIDFGDSLGSSVGRPKPRDLEEERFDWAVFWKELLSLGIYVAPHERPPTPVHDPQLGRFSAAELDPGGWNGRYYNLAFLSLTPRDARWAAARVTSFTDADLRAIVARADLPAAAADQLVGVLEERQREIGRYWFARADPLDGFLVRDAGRPDEALCFDDLALTRGLLTPSEAAGTRYRFRLLASTGTGVLELRTGELPPGAGANGGGACVPVPPPNANSPASARAGIDDDGYRVVDIQTLRTGRAAGDPVRVHLFYEGPRTGHRLVGIQR